MRIISFDCGIRTLAYTILDFNEKKAPADLMVAAQLKEVVTIKEMCTIDLLGSNMTLRDSNIIDRTKKLYEVMSNNKFILCDLVLIERQPEKINTKSSSICDQLIFYFTTLLKEIIVINPRIKNKIYFGEGEELQHKTFVKKYAKRYTANKNHTKANFKYYLNEIGHDIPKGKYDDIADAFMQALAFLSLVRQPQNNK